VLAPPGWGPLAAWLTGWSNWLVQITGAPSVDYALSAMILATASLNMPDYNVENYQIFLLTSLIMVIHGMISSMPTLWIARFNSVGTTMNILILIVVVILIPAATTNSPKFTDSATVWGTITNGTDWPDGIAVLVSFLSVIWTMSGYDAPFHLSEECSNANVASPRAIVMTSGVGGIMGWALQLVIAYTVTNISDVIDADQPWAGYCFQVLSGKAANAVIAMTIACAFMMGQGCMVAACTSSSDITNRSSSYIRIRSRWMLPTLAILVDGQSNY
jgi:amino acid transporter